MKKLSLNVNKNSHIDYFSMIKAMVKLKNQQVMDINELYITTLVLENFLNLQDKNNFYPRDEQLKIIIAGITKLAEDLPLLAIVEILVDLIKFKEIRYSELVYRITVKYKEFVSYLNDEIDYYKYN